LTKDSIENSRQILLTACGRSDNTDAVYNKNHTERISIGKTPVLYEVIEAELTMRTTEKALKVWSIDPDGAYTGQIPTTIQDGILQFRIGRVFPSIYYLITR